MRPAPEIITLVVTGSVAAVKTFLLADALRARGFDVRFVVTDSAWQFLKTEGKYAATPAQLAELRAAARADIAESGSVLIAPASADFIRQVARADTEIGKKIRDCGRPVFIAPAMNFMMWQHPAVQENVKRVLGAGMTLLGPLCGDMACGDTGFGRMAEPADIAAALHDKDHPLRITPLTEHPALPSRTHKPCRKILLVVQEFSDDVVPRVKKWMQAGYDVRCAAHAPSPELEKIIGDPVVTAHHQLYPKDGMEHIWLPEDADVVVMYPATPAYIAEMSKGAAETFIGCIYLATKRPVIVVSDLDCTDLVAHGAVITDIDGVMPAIAKLEQDEHSGFEGKHFLVLGGNARETVDSFRFYANTTRDESHGARVAEELRARGAQVTLLEASGSAADLLEQCRRLKNNFEAVIQFAGISQITCPSPVTYKISKTGDDRARLFDIVGNIDFIAELKKIFSAEKVVGYNNFGEWAGEAATPLRHKIVSLARRSAEFAPRVLSDAGAGKGHPRVLVTTGRTAEKITQDGVVITNGFTGRQGQEIARAFAARGAEVTLVSGPVSLPDAQGIRTVHVVSMRDMHDAVMAELPADIFVGVAAVADFSLPAPLSLRLKPGEARRLDMRENPSIVAEVARHNPRPKIVVSFAAQSPDTVLEYAVQKFEALGADLTVANPIGTGAATTKDPARNEVYMIYRDAGKTVTEKTAEMPKDDVARAIADKVMAMLGG